MKTLSLIVALAWVIGVTFYANNGKAQMGPGYSGHGMGWGYGMGWFGPIIMVAFWIAVIVAAVFLARWLMKTPRTGEQRAMLEDSPLEILKRRYARGEINKEEFEEKKKDLA
jgi:putative membrane protein